MTIENWDQGMVPGGSATWFYWVLSAQYPLQHGSLDGRTLPIQPIVLLAQGGSRSPFGGLQIGTDGWFTTMDCRSKGSPRMHCFQFNLFHLCLLFKTKCHIISKVPKFYSPRFCLEAFLGQDMKPMDLWLETIKVNHPVSKYKYLVDDIIITTLYWDFG